MGISTHFGAGSDSCGRRKVAYNKTGCNGVWSGFGPHFCYESTGFAMTDTRRVPGTTYGYGPNMPKSIMPASSVTMVKEQVQPEHGNLTGCPWHDVKSKLRDVGLRPTRT